MQRTIHMHGVDFEVEFTATPYGGDVDAIYIVGTEVTDVIRDTTKAAIASVVDRNAQAWAEEYGRQMADEARIDAYVERRAA